MATSKEKSKEPQYQVQLDKIEDLGYVRLGPTASHLLRSDPRHLGFLLARYKFVAKMLSGKKNAIEIGCGDGTGMRVVLQEVKEIHGVDFDPVFISWCLEQAEREGLNCTFSGIDIASQIPTGEYEAAYALDFIEHIDKSKEKDCLSNICGCLTQNAVCIIGTPNITSQEYASKWSREGHINLKSADSLRELMEEFFENVFIFSMNDEVIHTGYYPMAHHIVGMGVGVKGRRN